MAMSAKAARVGRSSGPGVPEQCSKTCQTSWLSRASSWETLAFGPVRAGDGGAVQLRVGSCLALEKAREIAEWGAGILWARSTLVSVLFGLWSPIGPVLDEMGPVGLCEVGLAGRAVGAGRDRIYSWMRCGDHDLPASWAAAGLGAPFLPKRRVGASGATLFGCRALPAGGSPEHGSGGVALSSPSAAVCKLRALLSRQKGFID